MHSFNGSDFSMNGSDGLRIVFDMKGTRSIYFKVTWHRAYNLFCKGVGDILDGVAMPDFVMEMLFSGVRWFSMGKSHGGGTRDASFCGFPMECAGKKCARFCFSTDEDALICMRFAYTHVTMRIK